jgi:hypothetical protein
VGSVLKTYNFDEATGDELHRLARGRFGHLLGCSAIRPPLGPPCPTFVKESVTDG